MRKRTSKDHRLLLTGLSLVALLTTPVLGSATAGGSAGFGIKAQYGGTAGASAGEPYAIRGLVKPTGDSATNPAEPPSTGPTDPNGPEPTRPPDSTPNLVSMQLNMAATGCNSSVRNFALTIPSSSSTTPSVDLSASGTIDWGDGTSSPLTTGTLVHSYPANASYTVSMTGKLGGISSTTNNCITGVSHFGENTGIKTLEGLFNGAKNIGQVASPPTSLENAKSMFTDSVFNGDTSDWILPNLKSTYYMFKGATSFNGDLGGLDGRRINDASYMFFGATAFQGKGLENWKMSSLQSTSYMFANATNFVGDLSSWNVSKIADFTGTFSGATKFNSNISSWDTSSAKIMTGMFFNASKFNQPIGSWNVSRVTDFSTMFGLATAFNQPLNDWDVSSATLMAGMFKTSSGAALFNQPLSKWNTANVTNMSNMFYDARNFKQDLSMWNVSKITDRSYFNGGAGTLTAAQLPKFK